MTRSRRLTIVSGVAALAVVGVLWLLFAPSQIGGRIDYVVIRGVSMEPRLHSGDLAVLQREDTYAVGDVVGYQSRLLHQFVLHRIVARRDNRFLFKGDHNNFVDSYFPTKQDLAGRLWFNIPRGGAPVQWLHVPMHAALLGGVVALLVLGSGGAAEARRRRARHRGSDTSLRLVPSSRRQFTALGNDAWLVAAPAIAALVFALFALAAFTHSRTRIISDPTAYLQAGTYSYSSVVPTSSVYPDGVVRSPNAVYTNLVKRLRITMHYRFSSKLVHAIDGKISLRASIRNADGWRLQLATSTARPFNGDTGTAAVMLDTKRLYDQLRGFAHDTGITNDSFTLDVVPSITLHGNVAGRPISLPTALAPLTFTINAQSFAVTQQSGIAGTVGTTMSNPLVVERPGTVLVPRQATITLLSLRIGVDRAKQLGVAGATLALLVAAALYLASRRRSADEVARILRRYGAWIVPVESPVVGTKVVDVSSMESLIRLADHYERAILHEEQERSHVFALEEDGTLFRYRLATGELQPLRATAHPLPPEKQVPVLTPAKGSLG